VLFIASLDQTIVSTMLGAFGLSWRLRDVPLRDTAGSPGVEGGLTVRPRLVVGRHA
jgi:hypothetical protein